MNKLIPGKLYSLTKDYGFGSLPLSTDAFIIINAISILVFLKYDNITSAKDVPLFLFDTKIVFPYFKDQCTAIQHHLKEINEY